MPTRNVPHMTAEELRDFIVRRLVKENAGGTVTWRRVMGELKVYARSSHAHCNWDVQPVGTAAQVEAVKTAVDQIRLVHPFVVDPR